MSFQLFLGDTLETLKTLPDSSVHSIVTDPPWAIKFMNRKWDYTLPSVEVFKEALRVLKPGGHLLCCCGTKTQHRMVVNIEEAGFEVRDIITHHYAEGMPKALDISKAIDKQAGAEREVVGSHKKAGDIKSGRLHSSSNEVGVVTEILHTVPATEEAKQWEGWKTNLKPATEFWTLCRKPLDEDTIAENILKHGTGGLNIDACRIKTKDPLNGGGYTTNTSENWDRPYKHDPEVIEQKKIEAEEKIAKAEQLGRYPSNLILDEYTASELDQQSGILKTGDLNGTQRSKVNTYGIPSEELQFFKGDSGGASRFFYVAKPSSEERNAGIVKGTNNHPTVKSLILLRYLIKLITPSFGTVLDLYNGSGSTGCACMLEDFDYIGIDNKAEYIEISKARIEYWKIQRTGGVPGFPCW